MDCILLNGFKLSPNFPLWHAPTPTISLCQHPLVKKLSFNLLRHTLVDLCVQHLMTSQGFEAICIVRSEIQIKMKKFTHFWDIVDFKEPKYRYTFPVLKFDYSSNIRYPTSLFSINWILLLPWIRSVITLLLLDRTDVFST